MKLFREKVIPATKEKIVNECYACKCDICGKREGEDSYDGIDWNDETYEIDQTIVSRKIATNYPINGGYELDKEIEYHICPDCFEGKLVPFIESFGGGDDK